MKKTTLLFFIILFQMYVVLGQQTIYDTILHDNIKRAFILYVPAVYDSNLVTPLLFNFHGHTSNSFEQMNYGDFRKIADSANFIIVHPMGTLDSGNEPHWNVGWGTSTTDDIGFMSHLIDSLNAKYNIDSTRIYSTGMSNGGFMSHLLACKLSSKIAAIASVTGSMTIPNLNSCNPTHPTPVLQIHGTSDPTVPYNGSGSWTASIVNVINFWKTFNNTLFEQIDTLPNINTTDGSEVVYFHNSHGDSCVDVELYKVLKGKHTWPGTAFGGSGTNYDFDASLEIWRFLSKFDLNGRRTVCPEEPNGVLSENNSNILIFPNPSFGKITIELENSEHLIEVFNELGTKVKQYQNVRNQLILNLDFGVYFIKIVSKNEVITKKIIITK